MANIGNNKLPKKVILASGSPRRREILTGAGLDFDVYISGADESSVSSEGITFGVYVQELALLKARGAAKSIEGKENIIISADTVVVCNGDIMGKPKDRNDASSMLKKLSGKSHSVFTGICVWRTKDAFSVCSAVETKVKFKELSDEKIKRYVMTGECDDKAGAYAVQGKGAALVEKIDGDYLNVVGLPLFKLFEILENDFDYDLFKGEYK